jgi:hypothetical protein
VTAAVLKGPGRPALPPEELEHQGLHRVAELAVSILLCLRKEGRGRYHSERQLRQWLQEDGVHHTTSEVASALTLLEATGRLSRPHTGLAVPRPGWLPTEADAPPVESPRARLAKLVCEVIKVGNGRSNQSSVAEIRERLLEADAEVSDSELTDILERLADVDRVRLVQRAWGQPTKYVFKYTLGSGVWEDLDDLESSICKVVKARPEVGYSDLDELKGWLAAAGVQFDEVLLDPALTHLMNLGRLQTPRADHWEGKGPRPVWYIEPPVRIG